SASPDCLFFNVTAPPEIYTLSLHDALPIFAGLSEFAEPLLGLVNELAREASFPEAEFERERRQKLEEVKLERTQPGFLASERLRKVLFGAHPYAQVSPSEAQVADYKRDDLVQTYRDFYTPDNALLLLVGDFDASLM